MGRMKGSHFSIAAFTNLSQDHLDFHKDMASYFQAKASLFTNEYADSAFINIDTSYGVRLAEESTLPRTSLSRFNADADWHFAALEPTHRGIDFQLGVQVES